MKRYILKKGLMVLLLSFIAISMYGVPAKPGLKTIKMADGSSINVRIMGDERFHYYVSEDGYLLARSNDDYFYYSDFDPKANLLKPTSVRANDIARRSVSETTFVATRSKELPASLLSLPRQLYQKVLAKENESTHKRGSYPSTGKQKSLVILVQFKDKKFSVPDTKQTFTDFMMKENFTHKNGAHASVRDYYLKSSDSQFDPEFDVYGPVTMPQNLAYYGANNPSGNDVRPAEMAAAACEMLDDEIDFSQYDRNNDGWVDNVYIFYAGYSEAEGASANAIWPHAWDIWLGAQIRVKLDGVFVGPYGCSQELNIDNNDLVGIGVFCHEFGHVLGLPDIYSTVYNPGCFTPGMYTLMDAGEYADNSNTPPLLSAYERWVLGWHSPEIIDRATNISLPPLSSAEKKSYMIKTPNKNEMFILENRQQEGFDKFIHGHGMLVWHIDYNKQEWENNSVNNIMGHQRVDLVEADGRQTAETRSGDPFPGTSKITSFTDNTYPSMRDWNGNPLNLPITEIKETDGIISFKVLGGVFELTKVVLRTPTEVTATSFTLSWSSVPRANDYLISVYTLNSQTKEYVFKNHSMGDVNSYIVTGLSPLNTYYAVVTASDGARLSEESAPVEAKTLEPDFSLYVPKVLPATSVMSHSFVANWESLDEATSYYLSVYKKKDSGEFTESIDFSDGISGLPKGWETNCNSILVAEGYYGATAPSLRMGKNGSYILSPIYNGTIKNISFWFKGQYYTSDNSAAVWVSSDGKNWQILDFMKPASGEEQFATYGEGEEIPIGKDACQFRITLDKIGNGFLYLDDIRVTVESKEEPEVMEGFDELNVNNVSSFEVKGLEPLTSYIYIVKGFNGEKKSLDSPGENVLTLDGSNVMQEKVVKFNMINNGDLISVIAEQGSRLEIYSISGTLVKSIVLVNEQTYLDLKNGAYLLKCNDKVIKAIVK